MVDIFDVPFWFTKMKHDAGDVPDSGGYDLNVGEFNPQIVKLFAEAYLKPLGDFVVWEPFAGHTRLSPTIFACRMIGGRVIAYDIAAEHNGVVKANSLEQGPGEPINGVVFHPPYFTTAPESFEDGEISLLADFDGYLDQLAKTAKFAWDALKSNGVVCLVTRCVSVASRQVHVDWAMVKLFLDAGFQVCEVYRSVPDVVVFLRKE